MPFGSPSRPSRRHWPSSTAARSAIHHLTCHDDPLNLAGALPDSLDPKLAEHPLGDVLAHVAAAAEDLHGAVGDPARHLRAVQLGHRRLAVQGLAVACRRRWSGPPRRASCERRTARSRCRPACRPPAGARRAACRRPRASCANAVISSTRRCAAPTQRAATIIRSNRNQSWVKVIRSPSAPTRWDAGTRTSVNDDDRMLVGDVVRIVRRANHFHARPRQVDHQQHVVARVLPVGQHRLDEHVVGEVERRDVPLDPVDDVLVAVAARGGLQRGHVGPGELLGDRVRLVLLAAHRGQQPALALVVGGHLGPPLRRRRHHPGEAVGDPAALLLHQHLLQRRAARTADRRRHVRGVQTQFHGPRRDVRPSAPSAAGRPRVRPRPRTASATRRRLAPCPGSADPPPSVRTSVIPRSRS